MKKTISRVSSFILALVMLLAVLCGCNKHSNTNNIVGNDDTTNYTESTVNTENTEDSTVTEPVQITTTIYEIAKHGNLILSMYGADLFSKGFEHGDIVEISVAGKTWEAPFAQITVT